MAACIGELGIAVLECSSCRMWVGAFSDDGQRTMLATVLAHKRPAEVVAAKGGLSSHSLACIKRQRSSGNMRGPPRNRRHRLSMSFRV